MNAKVLGTILGVAGMLLWFMPLAYVEFGHMTAHQTGNSIGGIAYLLLFASLAYTVLSWMEQHVPRIIAASLGLVICLMFLAQAGSSVAWGLVALIIVHAESIYLAVRDNKLLKPKES